MQALSVELNKELKLKEAQKPISKPKSKPRSKNAITRSQSASPSPGAKMQLQEVKVQIQDVNIANTTKRERIEFYPILNTWWMRINTCAGMRFIFFEGIWIRVT